MQYVILLVSEQKLKSFTSVNFSVDPNDLKPYIMEAQDLWLQNYLGSTFYEEIKTQIRTDTVNSANRDLLDDFIGPCLCNYALWKALPFLRTKIFNKSVMNATSESGVTVAIDELKFLRQEVMNTAEAYVQQMLTYLRNHPSYFPSYIAQSTLDGGGILPERGRVFQNSFVIPKRTYKLRNAYRDSWQIENDCPDCYEKNGPSTT